MCLRQGLRNEASTVESCPLVDVKKSRNPPICRRRPKRLAWVLNFPHGGKWKDVFPVEASIPDGIASLDSILCTDELRRRAWRPPDYEKENRALVALASALADPQSNILQTSAETILEVTQCDSSGLSLLTKG